MECYPMIVYGFYEKSERYLHPDYIAEHYGSNICHGASCIDKNGYITNNVIGIETVLDCLTGKLTYCEKDYNSFIKFKTDYEKYHHKKVFLGYYQILNCGYKLHKSYYTFKDDIDGPVIKKFEEYVKSPTAVKQDIEEFNKLSSHLCGIVCDNPIKYRPLIDAIVRTDWIRLSLGLGLRYAISDKYPDLTLMLLIDTTSYHKVKYDTIGYDEEGEEIERCRTVIITHAIHTYFKDKLMFIYKYDAALQEKSSTKSASSLHEILSTKYGITKDNISVEKLLEVYYERQKNPEINALTPAFNKLVDFTELHKHANL